MPLKRTGGAASAAVAQSTASERSKPVKLRNILTVLGTATLTALGTLTAATLWSPGVAQADIKPVIARPELKSQECTFVVKTDKASYEASQSPVISVTATNTTSEAHKVKVWVNVMSTGPSDPRSRMVALPRSLWTHEYAFELKAGETKTIEVACAAKLPAGQQVSIVLGDRNTAVLMNDMATAYNQVQVNNTTKHAPNAPVQGGVNSVQLPNQ
jgi:hypothetical protein